MSAQIILGVGFLINGHGHRYPSCQYFSRCFRTNRRPFLPPRLLLLAAAMLHPVPMLAVATGTLSRPHLSLPSSSQHISVYLSSPLHLLPPRFVICFVISPPFAVVQPSRRRVEPSKRREGERGEEERTPWRQPQVSRASCNPNLVSGGFDSILPKPREPIRCARRLSPYPVCFSPIQRELGFVRDAVPRVLPNLGIGASAGACDSRFFIFTALFWISDLWCLVPIVAVTFKSREDHRKQLELEEARKAGLAPVVVDKDGNEINPHIPQYMSSAPWYLNAEKSVSHCLLYFACCLPKLSMGI
jgi:hypothetical protein